MAQEVHPDEVVEKIGGRFSAAVVASRRARDIQAYYFNLGSGAGGFIPPQIMSLSRKALSVAMEEIMAGKVVLRVAEPSQESEDASDAEPAAEDVLS